MKKCYSECILWEPSYTVGFPGGAVVNNPPANAGDSRDLGSVLGLGQPPAVGNGNPLQYSCLENSTDNGACQAPLSMGFFRQEYWSGLPFPTAGDLPNPGTEPASRVLCIGWQILYTGPPGKPKYLHTYFSKPPAEFYFYFLIS